CAGGAAAAGAAGATAGGGSGNGCIFVGGSSSKLDKLDDGFGTSNGEGGGGAISLKFGALLKCGDAISGSENLGGSGTGAAGGGSGAGAAGASGISIPGSSFSSRSWRISSAEATMVFIISPQPGAGRSSILSGSQIRTGALSAFHAALITAGGSTVLLYV